MSEIRCAFALCWCRAALCERVATTFFRSVSGNHWPLCPACCDRHKRVAEGILKRGGLPRIFFRRAAFDIALDDREALAAYRDQDPALIFNICESASTQIFRTLCETASV